MAANPKTKAQIEAERKRKARSPARPPNVSRKDQEKGFAKGAKKALANMTPAQRKAVAKSARGSAERALQSDKDDETLKKPRKPVGERYKTRATRTRDSIKDSVKRNVKTVVGEGGAKSIKRNIAGLKGGGPRKAANTASTGAAAGAATANNSNKKPAPAAPAKAQTFGQAFAKARKAQGAGGTFDWKNPKTGKTGSYSTKRADDKPAEAPEKKGFFKNLGDRFRSATTLTPGRPRKPSGKKPMRTPSTGPWAKYDTAMKKFRKDQEASNAKAGGGRVTAKKPAAKKKMARVSVKKKSPRRP